MVMTTAAAAGGGDPGELALGFCVFGPGLQSHGRRRSRTSQYSVPGSKVHNLDKNRSNFVRFDTAQN